MTIKRISVGIGIPMIIVGSFIAIFLASIQPILKDTVEFVGSLIGILGVLIFIVGLIARKTPKIIS
jgi:flagellar biosynthesis protein FliQ